MSETAKREKKEIIIAENRSFEGVWIPKRLYITNKFNLRTKFFVVEIKSLSKNGYCFATDKHFAEFLGVSDRMVQTMIKQLKDDGYLTAEYEYEKDTRAIKRRFLILTQKFLDEFYNEEETRPTEKDFNTPPEENFNEPTEINFDTGTEKNCGEKYNNKTIYNSDLSNTDSSITDKYTLEDVKKPSSKGNIYTSVPEEHKDAPPKRQNRYITKDYTEEQLIEHIRPTIEENLKAVMDDCGVEYNTDMADTLVEVIRDFYSQYYDKTGHRHRILPDASLVNVMYKFFDPPGELFDTPYDADMYAALTEEYLSVKFDMEYTPSISHFMGKQMRAILYHRTK